MKPTLLPTLASELRLFSASRRGTTYTSPASRTYPNHFIAVTSPKKIPPTPLPAHRPLTALSAFSIPTAPPHRSTLVITRNIGEVKRSSRPFRRAVGQKNCPLTQMRTRTPRVCRLHLPLKEQMVKTAPFRRRRNRTSLLTHKCPFHALQAYQSGRPPGHLRF